MSSDFMHMWEQMGWIARGVVVILFLMSIWSISVMIERYLTYRKAKSQSREFAPAVADALKNGNLQEAIDLAEQHLLQGAPFGELNQIWIKDPVEVRADPRFAAILRRVGLMR